MKRSLTIVFFAAGFLLLLGTIDLLGWLPPLLLLVVLTRQERRQMEEEDRVRRIPGGIEWHN